MRLDVWNESEELCFVTPGEKWFEIGNMGTGEFEVSLQAPDWAELSETRMKIREEKRVFVRIQDVSINRRGEILIHNLGDDSLRKIPVRVCRLEYGGEVCALEEDGIVVLEEGDLKSNDFKTVPRLGRLQGDLLEACVQRESEDGAEPLKYSFVVQSSGDFLLEIHRFPSLNSVGRLRIGISLDKGALQTAESFSNDEWKGKWKENVLNNVDRLYLKLSVPEPGRHQLCVWALDRYFSFSRMVIYTKPRKENNLAGSRGAQPLPVQREWLAWCDSFYGRYELPPRPIYCVDPEGDGDVLASGCRTVQIKDADRKVTPEWYLELGRHIFEEVDGAVLIEAAAALAQSGFAWTSKAGDVMETKAVWRHCGSESHGQSGLAMYIRARNLSWLPEDAPSLNYRFWCGGGVYTLWMLSKFNVLKAIMASAWTEK